MAQKRQNDVIIQKEISKTEIQKLKVISWCNKRKQKLKDKTLISDKMFN